AEVVRALRNALARADAELRRAERTAEIAERHEQQLLTDPPPLQEVPLRIATKHRHVERHLRLAPPPRKEERHTRAAAAMHAPHATRLRASAEAGGQHHPLPRFMAS